MSHEVTYCDFIAKKKSYKGSINKNYFHVYKINHSKYPFTIIFYGQIYENVNINKGKAYIKGFFFIRPAHVLLYAVFLLCNMVLFFNLRFTFSGVLTITWPLMLIFEWLKARSQKSELIDFLRKISDKYA
jgi:hypothetical protein